MCKISDESNMQDKKVQIAPHYFFDVTSISYYIIIKKKITETL